MFIFLPVDSVKHLAFDLLSLLMILIFVEIVISNIIAFGAKLSPFHPVAGERFVASPWTLWSIRSGGQCLHLTKPTILTFHP